MQLQDFPPHYYANTLSIRAWGYYVVIYWAFLAGGLRWPVFRGDVGVAACPDAGEELAEHD
jgi:hypothetical protein